MCLTLESMGEMQEKAASSSSPSTLCPSKEGFVVEREDVLMLSG